MTLNRDLQFIKEVIDLTKCKKQEKKVKKKTKARNSKNRN